MNTIKRIKRKSKDLERFDNHEESNKAERRRQQEEVWVEGNRRPDEIVKEEEIDNWRLLEMSRSNNLQAMARRRRRSPLPEQLRLCSSFHLLHSFFSARSMIDHRFRVSMKELCDQRF